MVSPITLAVLKHLEFNDSALPFPIASETVNHSVAFVGIFFLGGIITGLVSLLFTLGCYSEEQLSFGNKMISKSFGLYEDPREASIIDQM